MTVATERRILITLGQMAARFGVREWQLRKTISRGFLPEPARAGQLRVFEPADAPAVEKALREAGYLE
jgi:hypothetical protein